MAKKDTQLKLDDLTKAIEKLIATPVAPVLPVLPIAPVLPVAPILPNTGDHDLLTRLEENVNLNFKQVKEAIQELTTGTTNKINDHEDRIRKIEVNVTKIMTWGTALIFVIGIAEFLLNKLWK